MSSYNDKSLEHAVHVPVPPAYSRQLSYSSQPSFNPNVDAEYKGDALLSPMTDIDSLKGSTESDKEQEDISTGKTKTSLLLFLRDSRIYIRVLAVLIMIVSFSLILTAVIMFAKAQNKPGHSLDTVPKPGPITDQPCIAFTGVAGMNLVLSISLLSLSCVSSKFRKSNNALNAVFAIISAVGFASSMGACFYLNKQNTLQMDLWKWSCSNHRNGIFNDDLDFNVVCQVVTYGWKFGLVQASLELLTFIISITAFVILKYSYFVRYGSFGKIF